MTEVLWLFGAGVLAGVVSVVASLASLVSYPALLAVGLTPLAANVTNTVALVSVGFGAAAGSGPELRGQRADLWRLGLLNAAGGGVGAGLLLLLTPASAFAAVVPVLVAGASLVLLAPDSWRRPGPAGPRPWLQGAVLAVAVYTGYFGAAGGVLALAVLTALLRQPLARTIAVKNVVSAAANGVAAVAFALFGPVAWSAVLPLAVGFFLGGGLGPALVRRLPAGQLRIGIALCGLAVAGWLAVDTYGWAGTGSGAREGIDRCAARPATAPAVSSRTSFTSAARPATSASRPTRRPAGSAAARASAAPSTTAPSSTSTTPARIPSIHPTVRPHPKPPERRTPPTRPEAPTARQLEAELFCSSAFVPHA